MRGYSEKAPPPRHTFTPPTTSSSARRTPPSPPKTKLNPPQTGLVTSQTGLTSPQTELVTPQTGLTSPQTGLVMPRTESTSPQTELVTPRTELTSPQTGLVPPQTGLTPPQTKRRQRPQKPVPQATPHPPLTQSSVATQKRAIAFIGKLTQGWPRDYIRFHPIPSPKSSQKNPPPTFPPTLSPSTPKSYALPRRQPNTTLHMSPNNSTLQSTHIPYNGICLPSHSIGSNKTSAQPGVVLPYTIKRGQIQTAGNPK